MINGENITEKTSVAEWESLFADFGENIIADSFGDHPAEVEL